MQHHHQPMILRLYVSLDLSHYIKNVQGVSAKKSTRASFCCFFLGAGMLANSLWKFKSRAAMKGLEGEVECKGYGLGIAYAYCKFIMCCSELLLLLLLRYVICYDITSI
jgi:hypothetical protein